jgi:hypothetical protein
MNKHKLKTDTIKQAQNNVLSDPLVLANHTLKLLKKGQREDALRHVQDFGRHQQVTVSWNHMIDHDMQAGHIGNAFKSFNEMKKRGQKPDAHTFTILFRGLAKHSHYTQSLDRAVALYHSMFAENSPVKPSTIHTNAVLQVCALAQDLDAIFAITARLPRRGPGSPDHVTYTTIFNCLRSTAWAQGKSLRQHNVDQETVVRKRQMAVLQGRKIWFDVLERWGQGMIMDERMVCSMGRLLLLGDTEKDFDDVLSLVEQTMRLSREVASVGSPARPTHLRLPVVSGPNNGASSIDYNTPEASRYQGDRIFEEGAPSEQTNQSLELPPAPNAGAKNTPVTSDTVPALQTDANSDNQGLVETADSVFSVPAKAQGLRQYATPSRNTLSLLIDACMRMNAVKAAHKYWAKLTTQFKPDLENYHSYLRLLRLSRSSSTVLELLKDLEAQEDAQGLSVKPEPKTYTIALSSCVRDGNNPSVLDTATEILNMMQRNIEDPQLRAAEIFDTILSKNGITRSYRQMREAAESLETLWHNARSVAAYGAWGSHVRTTGGNDFKVNDQLERDMDPAYFDTAVNARAGDGNRRVVTARYHYSLYGITMILAAQISRIINRHAMEMNQDERRYWDQKSKLVNDVRTRMGRKHKQALDQRRERNKLNPVKFDDEAESNVDAKTRDIPEKRLQYLARS